MYFNVAIKTSDKPNLYKITAKKIIFSYCAPLSRNETLLHKTLGVPANYPAYVQAECCANLAPETSS